MNLAQAVANYVGAYEGHTRAEGTALVRLRHKIQQATTGEIVTQNNALTEQHLWNYPLMNLFYDELLARIMQDTTFALTMSWNSIQDWLAKPYVVAWVGFEETYPVPFANSKVLQSENSTYFALSNASFSEDKNKLIIKMLMNGPLKAQVYVYNNGQMEIGQLLDQNQTLNLKSPSSNMYQTVTVNVDVGETGEWNMLNQMYQGLRVQVPVIVDPYSERLINQLIDLNLAYNIVADEGFTFEGNLLLSAAEPEAE